MEIGPIRLRFHDVVAVALGMSHNNKMRGSLWIPGIRPMHCAR